MEDVRKVDKVRVKHATVAKKVDVKRLKKDLWSQLETRTAPLSTSNTSSDLGKDNESNEKASNEEEKEVSSNSNNAEIEKSDTCFKSVVADLQVNEAQEDVSLAFYFICVLHLANEKCLKLENGEYGLNDFVISRDTEDANEITNI